MFAFSWWLSTSKRDTRSSKRVSFQKYRTPSHQQKRTHHSNCVRVRFDHVASVIINANDSPVRAAVVSGVSDCVRDGVRLAIPQATEMAAHRRLDHWLVHKHSEQSQNASGAIMDAGKATPEASQTPPDPPQSDSKPQESPPAQATSRSDRPLLGGRSPASPRPHVDPGSHGLGTL